MKSSTTALADIALLEPRVFSDERGYFFESYNEQTVGAVIGADVHFVQDNQAHSAHNVLRGLHYQIKHAQGKLVRVLTGAIYDVVVDLRRSSPTFGQWEGYQLSAENHLQLWVPPGFGHGYLVTSDGADVMYKTTDFWFPEHERCILWNDAKLAVTWPSAAPILSAKDQQGTPFVNADLYD